MSRRSAGGRPGQAQILLPLMEVLGDAPAGLSARQACTAVAGRLGIDAAVRDSTVSMPNGTTTRAFERDVRWARQRLVLRGSIDRSVRDLWRLTPKGRKDLRFAMPGVVVMIFETPLGAALWSEAEAALGLVEDGSVQAVVTSPPYELQTQKDYGGATGGAWLDWMAGIAREYRRILRPDGSLFLNLGDCYRPGSPTLSTVDLDLIRKLTGELGWHLAQRLVWHNPGRPPLPAEWVTVRRVRLKSDAEMVWWLSPTEHPKADNRRVLVDYSAAMRDRIATGGERGAHRPGGMKLAAGAFGSDLGGAIPGTVLSAANTSSNGPYHRYCRDHGLPAHPARFPEALAERCIRLATDEGDLVADFMGGSLTTAAVAERLNRRWISSELSLTYLRGAVARFPHAAVHAGERAA